MKLKLDKNSTEPIYQQIVEQIAEMIRVGELASGEKLPTERELKEEYGISAGTIKNAYKTLAGMNKVFSIQGSGTYVIRTQKELEVRRLRTMIDAVISRAAQLEISEKWIRAMVDQEVKRYRSSSPSVMVAWVSACEELLQMAETELTAMPLVQLKSYNLDQVKNDPSLLNDTFDLIITTERYYSALCKLVPEQQDKIYQTSLTMCQESIYQLMRLDENDPVLFWFFESRFEEIIRKRISLHHNPDCCFSVTGKNPELSDLLKHKVLIVPAKSALVHDKEMENRIHAAEQAGMHVIYIDYELDRGSLLFLRSLLSNTWNDKYRNGFCNVDSNLDYHRSDLPNDSVI